MTVELPEIFCIQAGRLLSIQISFILHLNSLRPPWVSRRDCLYLNGQKPKMNGNNFHCAASYFGSSLAVHYLLYLDYTSQLNKLIPLS